MGLGLGGPAREVVGSEAALLGKGVGGEARGAPLLDEGGTLSERTTGHAKDIANQPRPFEMGSVRRTPSFGHPRGPLP